MWKILWFESPIWQVNKHMRRFATCPLTQMALRNSCGQLYKYTPVNWRSNGTWTRIEDVFPIENGDIPASYVSLPEGTQHCFCFCSLSCRFPFHHFHPKVYKYIFHFLTILSLPYTRGEPCTTSLFLSAITSMFTWAPWAPVPLNTACQLELGKASMDVTMRLSKRVNGHLCQVKDGILARFRWSPYSLNAPLSLVGFYI